MRDQNYSLPPLPLESLRIILAICASNQNRDEPFRILSSVVKRAYFYAKAERIFFIDIPAEDKEAGDENRVGMLNLSLYGTRDAATNWQEEFTNIVVQEGFSRDNASPCNFYHERRNISIIVHGDGFTSIGQRNPLEWLQQFLDYTYECKHHWLGPIDKEEASVRISNRVISWTNDGISYEADQRHVEVVIEQLQLQEAKETSTPCTRDEQIKSLEENADPMSPAGASKYRMVAARLDYLAMDRPDIQYATKEASMYIAKPRIHHWNLLERIGRYFVGAPRAVQMFRWQTSIKRVKGHSDSDWAGDQKTRKSTSGGMFAIGSNTIKIWSSTQRVTALSSAGVELYALLKCACQALGVMNLGTDFGLELSVKLHIGASTSLAIIHRQGLGQLRHIDAHWLWIQDKVKIKQISIKKINGKSNPADLLTKHLPIEDVRRHMSAIHFELAIGRASKSLTINNVQISGEDYWTKRPQRIMRTHEIPRRLLDPPFQSRGGSQDRRPHIKSHHLWSI